jgi:hypothetical protein
VLRTSAGRRTEGGDPLIDGLPEEPRGRAAVTFYALWLLVNILEICVESVHGN